jgi:hypothetical protein
MSRSCYTDDIDDNWQHIMWRGQVASATKGRRGQKLLRELVEALDAMPEKKLVAHELQCSDGVCALGSVGLKRGVDLTGIDPEDYTKVANTFDIAEPLAREIVFMNDEAGWNDTPEKRWRRMRDWAASQILKPAA